MVRVKIWKVETRKEKNGKEVVTKIVNKRAKLLKETTVMDRTISMQESFGDEYVANTGRWMERLDPVEKVIELTDEEKKAERIKDLMENTRDELNEIATNAGVQNADDYDNKTQVAEQIVFIELGI